MGKPQENVIPSKKVVHNHNWMFEQIIRSQFGPRESLRQALTEAQFSLLNPDRAKLLSTKTTAPEKSLQDADAVIQVPLKRQTSTGVRVRYLVEHKSSFDVNQLMSQLLRYQYGLYEISKEPIITVVINNGPVSRDREQLSFQDCIADPGNEFWQVYGEYVLNFNAVILNLQDQAVQHLRRHWDCMQWARRWVNLTSRRD